MSKTHYRNVMKSDHLGVADLEDLVDDGKSLVFTIRNVNQEIGAKVAGRKIDANIAYFKENIKPLVLNATNSRIIANFCGSPFVEDWVDVAVELYVDKNVKMKGEVVGGIRISKRQPVLSLPVLNREHKDWGKALDRVKNGMSREDISKFFQVSDDVWGELCK